MKRNILYSILILALGVMLTTSCQTFTKAKWHPYSQEKSLGSLMELDYPFETNWANLSGGEKIAYVDEGEGEYTLILIHGLGSYLPAWKMNIPELSKNYRVIAIDLPGYGKSSKMPHSGLMTYYAGVIKEFIEVLGLKNVVLGGHSMGGQISMVTALHYPEHIDKIVLVAPAGFERFTEGQKQWFRNVMTVRGVVLTTAEDIITNLAYNFYNLPSEAEFMITDRISMRSASDFEAYSYAVVQSVNGMVNEAIINYLDQIEQPALILFGANDNLIPNRFLNPGPTREIAQYGASKIKNSKLVMVPKCGHFMMFEKPEVFNAEVKAFLK
ncbi:MAG: alpha/beta hydrolase [Tenuifilaceae bacterium]|jgi:pimeloyl-ACP methyl ester carboxylesterase|nr:alpha/beta hydrolase [Tenuifilaceae bacterium]